jgi:hypothetical protein
MPNVNLGDLVVTPRPDTAEHIVVKIIRTTTPAKPFELRELKPPNKDGSLRYEVPRSYIYVYYATDLPDGSVLTVMRRKDVPYAAQLELYESSIAAGLDVAPLKPEKTARKTGTGLNLDAIRAMGMKIRPSAKNNTVGTEL